MKRPLGLYVAWLVAAVLLVFAATGRHPYNFYTALRWICCAVFVYSAFTAREKNRVAWTWIFGALAALYNPIFRVHLDRITWASMNWFTVGAIAVATAFFWPRDKESDKESTVSLSEDKVEILPVSRRTVAREWLIFVALFALGFPVSFYMGNVQHVPNIYGHPPSLEDTFDYFWSHWLGLTEWRTLVYWFAPYFAATLARSIWWSIKALNVSRRVLYRTAVSILLVAGVCLGALVIKGIQKRSKASPYDALLTHAWESAPVVSDVVAADDLKKITLFDVEMNCQYGKGHTYCTGFHGRVRTDLPRAVEKVGLKASFYDATDRLIEVRTFDFDFTNGPLQPSKPSSFSVSEILPWNSKYRLEVSEARYVQ